MLVFKRFCLVAWTGFVRLACLALQSALHEYSKFAVGSRNASIPRLIASIFLLICVNRSSPHFAMFALDQTPFVLALVALLAFDHSDGETISVIRVLAYGACVVFMR